MAENLNNGTTWSATETQTETSATYTFPTAGKYVDKDISLTVNTLGITEETDPVFNASPAAGITSTNISNWNNKVSSVKINGETKTPTGGLVDLGSIESIGLSDDNNGNISFITTTGSGNSGNSSGNSNIYIGTTEPTDGSNVWIDNSEPSLEIVDIIYPVGSIYMSVNSVEPSILFGGTWERIKDTFLLSAGDTYNAGSTGGAPNVTLSAAQSGVPEHTHNMEHTHKHLHQLTYRVPGIPTSSSWYSSKVTQGTTTTRGYISKPEEADLGSLTNTQYDETASSKSNTNNNTSINATEAHENMPPYLAVYMWKRVA